MAQGQGIFPARQELGFTPTRAVRADIDVRGTGGAGGAAGRALVKGIAFLKERERKKKAIELKRQEMTDGNSSALASSIRNNADQDFRNFKIANLQETWQAERERINKEATETIGKLPFSPDALASENIRIEGWTDLTQRKSLGDATRQLQIDTIETQTEALTEVYRTGSKKDIAFAALRFSRLGPNMGKDKAEVLFDIKAAETAGGKLRASDAANVVYAAIEQATATGSDFNAAKELAKNPAIPESKQATLRSAIGTAEGAQRARVNEDIRLAKADATSTAIRESYQGTLTISELDKRHEAGLISDSAFIKMREGLAAKIPTISDRVARSTVNRMITDFKQGAATKEETEAVFLDNYQLLDEPDRKKFDNDIEIVFNKGVETSKREAKSRGAAIISPRFETLSLLDKQLRIFDTPEDAKQFDLEWQLRNIYEDSIDDWVAQQVKKGIDPTPRQIRIMANDLLIDFKNIKDSDELEANIINLRKSLRTGTVIGTKPLPKPVKELTTEEIRARIQRLKKKR